MVKSEILLKIPMPLNIKNFTQRAHGLRSGDVIIKDERTFIINQIHYDGYGPGKCINKLKE